MSILAIALYAEGNVDTLFLPPILQRTSEMIIAKYGRRMIDVSEPIIISKKRGSLEQAILQASREARGYDALIIHNDADNRTFEQARRERFEPGLALVRQAPEEEVCSNLVPVIPIRMTEAWMLVDFDAMCEVLGTSLSSAELGIPARAVLFEDITDPKSTLSEVIRNINATRSRHRQMINLSAKYELLARRIDLQRMTYVPSYKKFVDELTEVLEKLHFIPYGSTTQHL